jgi:hypothetical protein
VGFVHCSFQDAKGADSHFSINGWQNLLKLLYWTDQKELRNIKMFNINDQITDMLEAATIMMNNMANSGFPAAIANMSATMMRELQAQGFSREEAMQIITTFKLNQS